MLHISENPNLRLRSQSELWSRCDIVEFYKRVSQFSYIVHTCSITTFSSSFLRGWDGERKLSRRVSNTSTFVPNDRSQCLYCVLPIVWCAFVAHLDVSLAERSTPCRFIGTVHVSFPMKRWNRYIHTFDIPLTIPPPFENGLYICVFESKRKTKRERYRKRWGKERASANNRKREGNRVQKQQP